jgi:hypothetical protein
MPTRYSRLLKSMSTYCTNLLLLLKPAFDTLVTCTCRLKNTSLGAWKSSSPYPRPFIMWLVGSLCLSTWEYLQPIIIWNLVDEQPIWKSLLVAIWSSRRLKGWMDHMGTTLILYLIHKILYKVTCGVTRFIFRFLVFYRLELQKQIGVVLANL